MKDVFLKDVIFRKKMYNNKLKYLGVSIIIVFMLGKYMVLWYIVFYILSVLKSNEIIYY